MILCGPGAFDTSQAHDLIGWAPTHKWPSS